MVSFADVAQHSINRIQQVAAYHAYFINDQQLQLLQHFSFIMIKAKPCRQAMPVIYFSIGSGCGKTSSLLGR